MTEILPQPRHAAPQPPAVETAAPPPRPRDAFFDNAKFFAATLVVLGHIWEVFTDSHAARAAYVVTYGFHMPVFIFISGYFSRGFLRSTEKFRNIFPSLVVPYVIFIVPYRLQPVLMTDAEFRLHELFRPQFLMWFLVAMVFWRLSAPLWGHLRHPVAVSVVLSLVSGGWAFTADSTLCRAAGLLPFFVLGLTIKPEHVQALRGRAWTRWAGAAVLLTAVPVAYAWETGNVLPDIKNGVILWNRGYQHMDFSALRGMSVRLLALALAVVLGAAFLAVIPRNHAWYSGMGTRTMYVYLLHGLVVKGLDYSGVLDRDFFHTPAGLVSVTLAGVALAVALATVPVQRAMRWAVEPRARWLLKPSHGRT